MTLERLRIFVAVAERDHVTAAARALNLTQSAVSNALAALETEHDVRLFDRVGRGVVLNETGRAFLPEAKAVLARAAAAEAALADMSALRRGRLAVFASQTIASYWLPRYLVAFRRAYPGIEIRLGIGNTAQVAAAVHDGLAELGFVEGRVEDSALASRDVATDQLVLVVAPGHPWTGALPGDLAGLVAEGEWVLREPGSGTRSAFEALLTGAGLRERLRVALELPSNEAVRAAVEAGMGATVISASVAAPSLEAGLLQQLPFPLPERAYHVLSHRERRYSGAARRLLDLVTGAAHPTAGIPADAMPG